MIADGGIKYSGEITKAIAAGASSVMIGSLLQAWTRARARPSSTRAAASRAYRGMGSLTAMSQGSGERYFQSTEDMASAEMGTEEWCNASAPARTV